MKYTVTAKDNEYGNPGLVLRQTYPYPDAQCMAAFVAAMNAKASYIGMTNTTFYNPSGYEYGYDIGMSNAKSLAIMAAYACGYGVLCDVWSTSGYSVRRKGKTNIGVRSTFVGNSGSQALSDYYPILGGKTGSGSGYNTFICITEIEGKLVAGAIMDASSQAARFSAMKQLFDAATTAIQGGTPSASSVTDATKACAVLVPSCPKTFKGGNLTVLYAQNSLVNTGILSVTKTMSVIVALDYLTDINLSAKIVDYDVNGIEGSGAIFAADDIVPIIDLLYAMMLPSSNQAAHVVGRIAGCEILKYGLFPEIV